MKVLQINCVYGTGSTGKIVKELHEGLLNHQMDSVVCYGRGSRVVQAGVYKTCGELYSKVNHLVARVRGQLYGGCNYSTAKLASIIERENPDVVHLQCINGYFVNIPKLLNWLKKRKIKTVLTLHAEFMYTANCGHARECERWKTGCGKCPQLKTDIKSFGIDGTRNSWLKMKNAFNAFGENLIVVSVSPWLKERAMQSPFLKDKKHFTILNGLDTHAFFCRNVTEMREKYPRDQKIVFFATTYLSDASEDLKGGRYVIELAQQLLKEKIQILVAGQYDTTLKLPRNMTMLGRIESQDGLAKYYSLADVTILTSKRETFSMVTAESLCCGTPVVGFKAGGPESIALREFSEFVEQGNVGELKRAVLEMLGRAIEHEKLECKAREAYSSERMTQEYIEVYKALVGGM